MVKELLWDVVSQYLKPAEKDEVRVVAWFHAKARLARNLTYRSVSAGAESDWMVSLC